MCYVINNDVMLPPLCLPYIVNEVLLFTIYVQVFKGNILQILWTQALILNILRGVGKFVGAMHIF